MKEQEIWKTIDGYSNYQVSNFGRIRAVKQRYRNKQFLKPSVDKDGYLYVTLYNNKKKRSFKIHRLVANYFIPNPDNLPQVNHKDEDKTNNMAFNLEYCTASYNSSYGTRTKRSIKKKIKKVSQLFLDGTPYKEYDSLTQAAYENGFCLSGISNVLHGRRANYAGYRWEFVY